MKKSNIRVFGETSIAHVEKRGLFSYVVVRDCDKKVIAKSFSFRKYINDTIRTMYTGEYYATGDFILIADEHQSGTEGIKSIEGELKMAPLSTIILVKWFDLWISRLFHLVMNESKKDKSR